MKDKWWILLTMLFGIFYVKGCCATAWAVTGLTEVGGVTLQQSPLKPRESILSPFFKLLDGMIEANLLNTSGNSSASTFGLKTEAGLPIGTAKLSTNLSAFTARSDGRDTAEEYSVGIRGTYGYLGKIARYTEGTWEKDRFQGLFSRYGFNTGFTFLCIDKKEQNLKADVGFLYKYEARVDQKDKQSPNLHARARYNLVPIGFLSLSEDFIVDFDLADSENVELKSVTGLDLKVTDKVSLVVAYELKFRNDPVDSFSQTDRKVKTGIRIEF